MAFWLGVALKWVHLGSLLAAAGQVLVGHRWLDLRGRIQPLLAVALISGLCQLPLQLWVVSQQDLSSLIHVGDWLNGPNLSTYLRHTQVGRIWILEQALILAWMACSQSLWAVQAALAIAAISAGVWSGHAQATLPWLLIPAQVLHRLAVACWAGTLPCLLWRFRKTADVSMLWRFSPIAAASVVTLVLTGWTLGYVQSGAPLSWPVLADQWVVGIGLVVERLIAALVGTSYGQWMLAKSLLLVMALLAASRIRWHLMPAIEQKNDLKWHRHIQQTLTFETTVAWAAITSGLVLSSTVPAMHEAIVWPWPYRWSMNATWLQPDVPLWVMGSIAVLLVGMAYGVRAWMHQAARQTLFAFAVVVAALGTAAWALAVPAVPDTYRRSEVPYAAESIARGIRLFEQHCTKCHGQGAHGDGPLAAKLTPPPADLSAPHTALHTAGDMYAWIGAGKPGSAMPGFSHLLQDDDRWDLINFLRAFSAGYQARILDERVVPNRPWLGFPDMTFQRGDQTESLKDHRGKQAVLLLYLDRSQATNWSHAWQAEQSRTRLDLSLIHLPLNETSDETVQDVLSASSLFARTRTEAQPDAVQAHIQPMALLIDRFGYLRARFLLNQIDGQEASTVQLIAKQVAVLNKEERQLPDPDEHVH